MTDMACQLRRMDLVDDAPPWDGDFNTLTPGQRTKVLDSLAQIAFAGDQAAMERVRAEAEAQALRLIECQ